MGKSCKRLKKYLFFECEINGNVFTLVVQIEGKVKECCFVFLENNG